MMKKTLVLAFAAAASIIVGCKKTAQQEVVKETYIHKYGVPVAKEDWSRNGKDGQVSQLMSDGITITRSYEKGILHGKTTYSYPNSSTPHFVENYDHATLLSRVEHTESGIPFEEVCFLPSGEITKVTRWYEEGTPSALESYENGFLVQGEYRNPLNEIESRVQDGFGTRLTKGNSGELISKDTIQNGRMIERVSYFVSGDPASITPYENGQIHGMRLTFLPGGLPCTVEEWSHGKQEGMTIVYLNGEKVAEIPYVNGQKQGIENRFKDGKTLVEEVTWRAGVQHGPRKILADDAEKVEWYHDGELVSRPTYERLNPPAR